MRLRRLDSAITYLSIVVVFIVVGLGLVLVIERQLVGLEDLVAYCRAHLDEQITGDFGGKCSEIVKNYDEFNRTSIMGHSSKVF